MMPISTDTFQTYFGQLHQRVQTRGQYQPNIYIVTKVEGRI